MNKNFSVYLTITATVLAILAAIIVSFTAPWLLEWLFNFSDRAGYRNKSFFMITVYLVCILGVSALVCMLKLLDNIRKDEIFIQENTGLLRIISWFCFICGVVCAVSALYYLPWGFVACALFFVGLIIRVIKNIFSAAISLKAENDYTI